MDSTDIYQIATKVFGSTPSSIAPTSASPMSSPYVWLLVIRGQAVYAKIAPPHYPGSALVEAWAYQKCARLGIRVPKVLAVSEAPECVFVSELPGETPWFTTSLRRHRLNIWREAGADLRLMHDIRLPGFGPLVRNDG